MTTGSLLASTWESSSTVRFGPVFEDFVCRDATTPYPNGVSSVGLLQSDSRSESRRERRSESRRIRSSRVDWRAAVEDVAVSSLPVVSESVFAPFIDFFTAVVG